MIKTDKHEALLPKASFTVDGGKLLFAMTQAQLNAEIEEDCRRCRRRDRRRCDGQGRERSGGRRRSIAVAAD